MTFPNISEFFTTPQFILILYLIGSLLIIVIAFFIFRKFIVPRISLPGVFKNVTLLILMPKESAAKFTKEEEEKPTGFVELIAMAENLYATLGGMKPEVGPTSFIFGRQDHIALEIVAHQGLISFYVTVPKYMQRYIEHQIHAQHPEAQIEEVEDYNIFSPRGVILGTYLKLRKSYIFPIKTYKKIETDPLNALTNVLSKIREEDGVAIQILIRSAHASWHERGARIASKMQQGKTIQEAMGSGIKGIFGEASRQIFQKPRQPGQLESEYERSTFHHLSPMEEELVKGLEEKTAKAGFDVNIRIISSAPDKERAKMNLNNVVGSFTQYRAYEYGNGFIKTGRFSKSKLVNDFIYRSFNEKLKFILNTEEVVSIYHFPLPSLETPNIRWLLAKKAPAPPQVPQEGIILGRNIYRSEETLIRIERDDRRRHIYIIGKSGTGKSVLLANMARQDIQNGDGVCVIDPHGDLVEDILEGVPKERADEVIYFNPSDMERPVGLNMLEAKTPEEKDFAIQEMIAIFYKLFPPEMIGPMFEHNMRNAMLTLMEDKEYPGTIAEIPRVFSDKDFQNYKLKKVKDPVVRAFWEKEMAKTSDFHKSEMLGYLISKVGRFVENEMMRNIIGQSKSGFDLRDIIDKKKILLVNLAKGKTGEVNSNLLGLIIVSKLQMAALARASLPQEERHDFYLYIDEFQNFVTDSISTILSEARKYRLNLIIAHQYIGQLIKQPNDTSMRDAVLGNAGTMIAFKIGVEDTEIMAKEFAPTFSEYDLINVEKFTAYVKLLVDNQASRPFNMHTFPLAPGDKALAQNIKQTCRLKYGREKAVVEREILEKSRLGEPTSAQPHPMGERNM